jgi:Fe-S cluster assembly iron-binding protein IscA
MHAITEFALESITIKKGHEELEILRFSVVRGGCEQQEMAGDLGEELAEAISLVYFTSSPKKVADILWPHRIL